MEGEGWAILNSSAPVSVTVCKELLMKLLNKCSLGTVLTTFSDKIQWHFPKLWHARLGHTQKVTVIYPLYGAYGGYGTCYNRLQ